MEVTLTKIARAFYGLFLVVMGINQLYWRDLRTVLLPAWPEWRVQHPEVLAIITGVILIGTGILIIINKKARAVALITGCVFLCIVIFWHLPYMLFIQPHQIRHLGLWVDLSKLVAHSGGAFIIAASLPKTDNESVVFEKFISVAPYLFCFTIITFGVDHFLYAEGIATLVPSWIPGGLFWTYVSGAALIAAGTAIVVKVQVKLAALLLSGMILIWFFVLHVPRAIADPVSGNGNEVVSSGDALAFVGVTFLIAMLPRFHSWKNG